MMDREDPDPYEETGAAQWLMTPLEEPPADPLASQVQWSQAFRQGPPSATDQAHPRRLRLRQQWKLDRAACQDEDGKEAQLGVPDSGSRGHIKQKEAMAKRIKARIANDDELHQVMLDAALDFQLWLDANGLLDDLGE